MVFIEWDAESTPLESELMKGLRNGIHNICSDLHQHPAVGEGREQLWTLDLWTLPTT